MSDRFQVSQSKIKKWRMCHFAYHARYVEHLKRKVKSRPLTFGTIIHEMLDVHANGGDPFAKLDEIGKLNIKLFAAEREMYGEIVEDCRAIMEAYFSYYENDPLKYIRYNKSYAEHWLEVDLSDELLFVMKVDAFSKSGKGFRWITENKTFSRLPGDDDRWRNLQSSVYLKAAELLGMKPFDGMLWNYIKSKAPKIPQINQSGSVSIRDIDTLPSVVLRTLAENDISPDDAASRTLLERAERNIPNYFFRIYTPINQAVVDMVYEDFVDTAHEVMECHGKKKDRNIDRHCSWCDYEPICRAELTGADADFVREREYTHGEDDDQEVDSTPGGDD